MEIRELVVIFFVFGGGFWILAPLARALARRIEGTAQKGVDPQEVEHLRDELRQVRQEMAELAERTDFTERLLARLPEGQRLDRHG
ncbi:MAG TPA: hypothetical protein VJN95_13995 [Gemmatimonadales bacterium]|nr:hypothetical protein [Gemmatimonadales bacterium]